MEIFRGAGASVPAAAAAIAIAICGCGAHTEVSATQGSTTTVSPAKPGGEGEVDERGIKGESASEVASNARISATDCDQLAAKAERLFGRPLSRHSNPRPPASSCKLSGGGASVSIYLDAGFAAHERYYNRITETVQFGETDPAQDPHPVPHVGERAIDNSAANWIPALGSLLAVRGNRWLTVTLAEAGAPDRQLRDDAADLARLGFHLTAE